VHIRRTGSGEPLLFLHGAQGLSGWDRGLKALANHFEVIAPDHPGFGRSGNSEIVDDVSDLALFYLSLLEKLDLKDVHVVGQCVGGWLAMEIAIRSTSRIKTLTLVNSAGIRLKGVPRADMFICTQDELMGLLFAGNSSVDWLNEWKSNPELEDAYERNTFAAAKFTWQPRLCNLKLDRWLHRINVPTHIIWGEKAKVIPPAYGEALKGLIPDATLTTLPDCGHLAHYEQPEALATEISNFTRRAAQ
jgi:pimeloyl-ACP methyl ester carboxylesterase